MSAHTPGPWRARTFGDVGCAVFAADGTRVAESFPPDVLVLMPNARLIAAAPDLLAALKMVLATLGKPLTLEEHEAFVAAHKAIDAAEGES